MIFIMENLAAEIRWKTLYLALPRGGVARAFPSSDAYDHRLRAVRFPHGIKCLECNSSELSYLTDRCFYHCRDCRSQFSLRQGTVFERSNLMLRKWFLGAELATTAHAMDKVQAIFSISSVMMRLSVARSTAVRVRRLIPQELLQCDGGLLGQCISLEPFEIPPFLTFGTQEHLFWLNEELNEKRR
jgi:transposase-like protein